MMCSVVAVPPLVLFPASRDLITVSHMHMFRLSDVQFHPFGPVLLWRVDYFPKTAARHIVMQDANDCAGNDLQSPAQLIDLIKRGLIYTDVHTLTAVSPAGLTRGLVRDADDVDDGDDDASSSDD